MGRKKRGVIAKYGNFLSMWKRRPHSVGRSLDVNVDYVVPIFLGSVGQWSVGLNASIGGRGDRAEVESHHVRARGG